MSILLFSARHDRQCIYDSKNPELNTDCKSLGTERNGQRKAELEKKIKKKVLLRNAMEFDWYFV